MTNPFTPSTVYPAVTYDADPKAYVALGRGVARGKREFVMSRGELVRFNANPWKWMRSQPDEENDAMAWGSLVDCLTLTPHRMKDSYEVCPETYPAKAAKGGEMEDKPWNWNAGYCKDWRDRAVASGRSPLKLCTLESAREASARLMGDPLIARLMECSRKQVQAVVEYRDKDTGIVVQVKALLDLVPAPSSEFGQFLADLKTTQDASIQTWERTVFARGYEVQAGLYTDAFNAAAKENRSGFLHAVQESGQPYAVARRMLSGEFMELGRDAYKRALKHYCHCLATENWPSYDDFNDNAANPILDGWRLTQPSPWMIAA